MLDVTDRISFVAVAILLSATAPIADGQTVNPFDGDQAAISAGAMLFG
jgi:hypothetical protein